MDDEYIRKAVELADGWYLLDNGRGFCSFVPERPVNCELPGPFADLLAAQLVRQVDTLEFVFFDSDSGGAGVVSSARENVALSRGDSRTMNTIKAIVDSGVLK
jgi:hypothetical protein